MKKMTPEEWESLFKKVGEGDILIVPQDKTTAHYNKDTIYAGHYGNFTLEDKYEVEVIKKYDIGFITTLVKDPLWQPLTWTENYNFEGTLIKGLFS